MGDTLDIRRSYTGPTPDINLRNPLVGPRGVACPGPEGHQGGFNAQVRGMDGLVSTSCEKAPKAQRRRPFRLPCLKTGHSQENSRLVG
jgi:hypothetical protein